MIKTYKDENFSKIAKLLTDSHIHDFLSEKLIREKLYDDPGFDAQNYLLFEQNGEVLGFLLGIIREVRGEKIGYIKLMAVDQNHRRKGIARRLLTSFEQNLKQAGVAKLRIYDVPLNYFMPGVDPRYTPAVCFAQRMGFKHISDAINMEVSLDQDFNVSNEIISLQKKGIEIKRAGQDEKPALIAFLTEWWALWQNEVNMAYRNNPVSVHIALKDNKVLAFSAYEGNNKGTGWFGPMGTHPDLRGLGVGNVLLKLCLDDMKNAGHKKSTIPWVDPIGFYSNYVNANISRVFWRFEKLIN
jgi:mycothiol synthase